MKELILIHGYFILYATLAKYSKIVSTYHHHNYHHIHHHHNCVHFFFIIFISYYNHFIFYHYFTLYFFFSYYSKPAKNWLVTDCFSDYKFYLRVIDNKFIISI